MAKLSHIDDFEEKPQDESVGADLGRPDTAAPTETPAPAEAPAPKPSASQAEADFHGISSAEKMPIGQKAIIVAAAIVFIAVVAYIVHYLFF